MWNRGSREESQAQMTQEEMRGLSREKSEKGTQLQMGRKNENDGRGGVRRREVVEER